MTSKTFLKFSKNLLGRDFVATDVHGHFNDLNMLLQQVGFDPEKDRLFLGGDLVDRGPQSALVLDWLSRPWVHSVLGNHDQMCIDAGSHGRARGVHTRNGGEWFYKLDAERRAAISHAFEQLPFAIEVEAQDGRRLGIVHAECPFDDWDEFLREISTIDPAHLRNSHLAELILWSRTRYRRQDRSPVGNIDALFVGHTALVRRQTLGNIHYIDTGACCVDEGGFMTLVDMNTNEAYDNQQCKGKTS